ncbi:hypothetical protein JTF08_13725 [Micrococcaceae bacterium RIT802]|nr:hypothetical protein [Micrococcaceae bacterium RIT 802]
MRELDWAEVEYEARAWLQAGTGRPVFTETGSGLGDQVPAYKLEVVGGNESDVRARERAVLVEVESFDIGRGKALAAGRAADRCMCSLAQNGTEEWYVDEVAVRFIPAIEPYENETLRRTTATYELTIRPR